MTSDPLLAPSRRRAEPEPRAVPPPFGRRRLIVALVACSAVALAAVGVTLAVGDDDGTATTVATVVPTTVAQAVAAPTTAGATAPVPTSTVPSIDVPGTLWWVVNRDRPLPDGYVPPDLVTPSVPLKPDTGATQVRQRPRRRSRRC